MVSDVRSDFPLSDPSRAFSAGLTLIRADKGEVLLPLAKALVERYPADPRMHQLLGLAARQATASAIARDAFAKAARLAPADPLIAHSRARTAMEAGEDAVPFFERAVRLAPADAAAHRGLAAALVQSGRLDEGADYLRALLRQNPLWLDAHRDLAHICGQMGADPLSELTAALTRLPASHDLHALAVSLALENDDYSEGERRVESALAKCGETPRLMALAALIASERGQEDKADTLFARLGPPTTSHDAGLHARHMIRCGRHDQAANLLEPLLASGGANTILPYLSLAWRGLGDPRWAWLEGDERLVQTYEVGGVGFDWTALVDALRALHFVKRQPLDQSVRGGTQTNGNLLLRTQPIFVKLKALLSEAVASYIAQLPSPDPAHPFLLVRRNPQRVAGSWSVRLTGGGYHADHVHSEGWISSALYVVVPDYEREGAPVADKHAGWLALGEAREVTPAIPATRLVEPRRGRLVLFPSFMWHGTRPFPAGERMTVAFDIARPTQDPAP